MRSGGVGRSDTLESVHRLKDAPTEHFCDRFRMARKVDPGFRIQPLLAGASAIVLAPVLWWLWTGRQASLALAGWISPRRLVGRVELLLAKSLAQFLRHIS